jgi:hypothetical protein
MSLKTSVFGMYMYIAMNTSTLVQQGCQMVYFQTKNPNSGKIWRALERKMLSYFVTIWNILLPFFGIIYGRLV